MSLGPEMYLLFNHSSSSACIMVLPNLPLFSFITHTFLPYHVGNYLWHARYGFGVKLGKVQSYQRLFICYSLLGMLPNMFEELEA